MANIDRTKVVLINEAVEVETPTALTTSVKYFDFAGKDDKTCIILTSSAGSAVTVTFKAGDGLAGVSDLEVSVGAGKTMAIRIDSAAFKIVNDATNKGAVGIKASATGVTASLIELP